MLISQGIARDRSYRTLAGNIAVADGEDTRTAKPCTSGDLVGDVVDAIHVGVHERHRPGPIVNRAGRKLLSGTSRPFRNGRSARSTRLQY